jgi:co-chaperonin GroES (HSP10)
MKRKKNMTTEVPTTENTSGLRAVEYKVLIKPDIIIENEDKKSAGGIIMPDATVESDQAAQVKGTIISVGGSAFTDWDPDERKMLKQGARVYYSIYEGVKLQGADGGEYRLCNDKNILAVVLDEHAAPVHIVKGRNKGSLGAAA